MAGEGFGQTANVLETLRIRTAEGVVPITVIRLLYDVIIDHITLKCDLQPCCNVNKTCFPCRDCAWFFLAHGLFWGLSLCPFSPKKKRQFQRTKQRQGGRGTGPDIQLTAICFAQNHVLSDTGRSRGSLEERAEALLLFVQDLF